MLNGVSGALKETVLVLAKLLLRWGDRAGVEVECIEKTGVWATGTVRWIHH